MMLFLKSCFWSRGDALALPFANPCNVLGSIADFAALRKIRSGDKVRVEKA